MAITLADAVVNITGDDSKLGGIFKGAKAKTDSFVGGLASSIMTLGTGAVLAGVGAAAAGVVAIGTAAFNVSNDIHDATKDIQTQFGLTGEEATAVGDVIRNVWGDNFGGSISEVGEAVATVRGQMDRFGEMTSEQLENSTKSAIGLRDAFDVDIAESTNAASALMEQFGLTSEEAFDFIQAGLQGGLNKSGDFLDTVSEYSNQFSEGGATAAEFFSVLDTGLQAGVLGTDKAADLFKEFGLRIQDGSKGTAQALTDLGLDADAVMQALNDGSMDVMDVFGQVSNAIRLGPADELTKFQAGVALMGSQFEDMGETAVGAIDPLALTMGDISNMTGDLSAQYDTMGNTVEGFKRRFILAFEPVGEQIRNVAGTVLTALMPHLETLATWLSVNIPIALQMLSTFWTTTLQPVISNFISQVQGQGVPILQALSNIFQTVLPLAMQVFSDIFNTMLLPVLSAMWEMFQTNILPILQDLGMWFMTNLPIAIETLTLFWTNTLQPVLATFVEFLTGTLIPKIGELFDWLNVNVPQAVQFLTDTWETTLKPALQEFQSFVAEEVVPILEEVWEWLEKNLPPAFKAAKSAMKEAWETMQGAIETAWGVIKPIFDAIETFGNWLSGFKFKIDFDIGNIPDLVKPGSPTPLEMGIRGVNEALESMRNGMAATVGQLAPTPNRAFSSNDQFNFTVANASDAELAAALIEQSRRNQIRDFMNRS